MNPTYPSPTTHPQSFVPYALVPGAVGSPRERILIVDDSATVRSHFVKRLHGIYDCFQAQNVGDALDRLKQHSFDLVITDVLMPGLSGVELLRIVVDKYPRTAVVVIS